MCPGFVIILRVAPLACPLVFALLAAGPPVSPLAAVSNKTMARAFGLDVCKTVQETLRFPYLHEWRTSDQLEHLEEMETASRAVFERHKKHIRDEQLTSRDEHATHMCTLARQLNAVLDAEQNTIDAFQRKRKKLNQAC